MATLIEHFLKLTDHRERDLLELTLSKAMIDLLGIDRVVVARVMNLEGNKHWLDVVRLDIRGGGKVVDPMRIDISTLPRLEDAADRVKCLQRRDMVEVAWAGENGPRISYFPLFADSSNDDEGVIEVHSGSTLGPAEVQTIDQLRHLYRNMFNLLAYSDRDALTGLLNRKSLDDAFYSAVLEELDGVTGEANASPPTGGPEQERRHRVPANYWLGLAEVDQFRLISAKHGHLIAEEVLLLVARILNNTFRTYDQIYRFDGEHFGVLMHCPQEAVVLAAFERFRANVEKFNFLQVGRITVSCGFTMVMADDSPSSALEKTERTVDFAKRNGHNKVCSHLELVRSGLFGDVVKAGAVDLF